MTFLGQNQPEETKEPENQEQQQHCRLPRVLPPSPPPSPSPSPFRFDLRAVLNAKRVVINPKPNDVIVSVREGCFMQTKVVKRVTDDGVVPVVKNKVLALHQRQSFLKETGQPLYQKGDAVAIEVEQTPSSANIDAYLFNRRPQSLPFE